MLNGWCKDVLKIIVISFLSLGLVFSELLVFEYVPLYNGEGGPEYFGFPFIYRTDTTWPYSMSAELYLKGLIGDFLFWYLILYVLSYLLLKINKVNLRRVILIVSLIIGVFNALIGFGRYLMIDWEIKLDHNEMKRDFFIKELDYKRSVHCFFSE